MKIIVKWFKESALMEKALTLPLFIFIPAIFYTFYDIDGWAGIGQLLSMISFAVIIFGTIGLYVWLRINKTTSKE